MSRKPSDKAVQAVAKVIDGGGTIEEIMQETKYAISTVEMVLSYLEDNGKISKESLGDGRKLEYYLISDPKDLADIKPRERKDKSTGIRMTVHESQVYRLLRTKNMTVGELSRTINKPTGVSKEYIYTVMQSLRDKGFAVNIDEARKEVILDKSDLLKKGIQPLELEPLYKHRIRIGVISDTHYASKYQQPTLINTAYTIFDEEKVDFVLHMGDMVDGIKMYRGQEQEIFLHSADEQANYAIEQYPYRKAYKTYVVAGNHDLSFKKIAGYDIVKQICSQRDDLVYKGEIGAHTFRIKNLTFETLHPTGGIPYAKSYRIQKLIEAALGDVIAQVRRTKDVSILPQFMFVGHLHIANYTPHIGVDGFMVPCMQAQTPYLRAKGLQPELGIYIIDIRCDDEWNVNRIVLDHRKFNAQVKENDF